MTPEEKASQVIEQRLIDAGWVIQDFKAIDLGAARGVAVRQYPTATGPADYVLFIDRQPVGIIEAKRPEAGEHLTTVEEQTHRYAVSALKWCGETAPLPFLFESTGAITRFTDARDPAPRSREVFHFFRYIVLQVSDSKRKETAPSGLDHPNGHPFDKKRPALTAAIHAKTRRLRFPVMGHFRPDVAGSHLPTDLGTLDPVLDLPLMVQPVCTW